MTHEADLDGRCENCGMLIGFHGTHASDADCVRDLKEAHAIALEAIHEALAQCHDHEAYALRGPEALLVKVQEIFYFALAKLNVRTKK